MQLARVIGSVVASVKSPGLEGVRLLVVQPLDRAGQAMGNQLVAADAVHMAGPGELVYVVAAREAAVAMPDPFVPVDHAIVGIVDSVAIAGEATWAGDAAQTVQAADTGEAARAGPKVQP